MQLGFVSAILPDLTFEATVQTASELGFSYIEAMCWPIGKAERRYAGVTHLDVTDFSPEKATHTRAVLEKHGVSLSALGYYPNPLCADETEAVAAISHLHRVIEAAALLGLGVNTFIGRDPQKSLRDNWALFDERWPAIIRFAEEKGVKVAIENCPMLFSPDEWPGGKNMAVSPKIWREMFERIDSPYFGLNYDPSHLVWQFIDESAPLAEFAEKIFHVHAKDLKIHRGKLDECGILDFGWNSPKIPGLGDVNWAKFFSALSDTGYAGPIVIEVEDRAFEGSLESRKQALKQSKRFLENWVA